MFSYLTPREDASRDFGPPKAINIENLKNKE
jgi:hypothetical protein